MLRKSNKNSGMSLIEVIVSMLVLSIAVVAVTMSFSAASKMNLGSKQKQSVESLMENLLEYTEAGGTEYETWFHATGTAVITPPALSQEITLYQGVPKGMYSYDVRVTVDNNPTEYETNLNTQDVIKFGTASSSTVMVDASLLSSDNGDTVEFGPNVSDYDELGYNWFVIRHMQAVYEANEAGAEPPLDVTPANVIPTKVDRELWLEVTTPVPDKMQLTAYMTYTLDNSILLPTGISHTYPVTLFTSDLYDLPTDPDPDAMPLSQVYIMYSKAALEPTDIGLNQDIRIIDPGHVMKANLFIAKQLTSTPDVGEVVGKTLGERDALDAYNIRVSFRNPENEDEDFYPAGGDIYCSGTVILQDAMEYGSTDIHNNNLVARGEEVRVTTTTLEILKPGTNTVLASKKVTHLQ